MLFLEWNLWNLYLWNVVLCYQELGVFYTINCRGTIWPISGILSSLSNNSEGPYNLARHYCLTLDTPKNGPTIISFLVLWPKVQLTAPGMKAKPPNPHFPNLRPQPPPPPLTTVDMKDNPPNIIFPSLGLSRQSLHSLLFASSSPAGVDPHDTFSSPATPYHASIGHILHALLNTPLQIRGWQWSPFHLPRRDLWWLLPRRWLDRGRQTCKFPW